MCIVMHPACKPPSETDLPLRLDADSTAEQSRSIAPLDEADNRRWQIEATCAL